MNHLKLTLLSFITFSIIPCYAIQAYGIIEQDIITTDMIERSSLTYVSDAQSYTSGIGGIIFSYPAGWFTLPPVVQVSISQDAAHPLTETYVAEIAANSTSSTTVIVYQISGGVVSEAPTGVVSVCLFAIDDPA